MSNKTALKEFIKWGDKMMKDYPMKELGFGQAIDKAVELLALEEQTEISDEEIEQKSVEYSTDTATKDFCEPCCHDFQNGAKWYREQLKGGNNA